MTRSENARAGQRSRPATARLRAATPDRRTALHSGLPALAAVLLAIALVASHALARDVNQVLADLEASAAGIVDVAFVLEGVLIDEAGQNIRVEVEVLAIPGIPAAGLYILRPDAIADNQIVIDGDVVRSYTFLTNQVALFDIDDPDAFGGLIEADVDGGLPIDLDLAAVFEGWDATIVGDEETPRGNALVLRFDNLDPDAAIDYVVATVVEATMDPWRLAFYRSGDELFADLTFRDWQRDQGLTREDVTYLPDDAEVLDRRKN
jgi:outer membrane lipoprotein-sorting protein